MSDVYLLVQQTMTQPLMKDYVPFSWVSMVQVKSEHFRALSHYYAAVALCDHTCKLIKIKYLKREHSRSQRSNHNADLKIFVYQNDQ